MAFSDAKAMPLTLAEHARHLKGSRIPRLWFITDERRSSDPLTSIASLPAGSGVIFRHYGAAGREHLAKAIARLCRRRRITLLIGGDWRLAQRVRAGGLHLPEGSRSHRRWKRGALLTAAAHSEKALVWADRVGADAVFLSPLFPTASHPGARALGTVRFSHLVRRRARTPVIALGGVAADRSLAARRAGASGFAAIGALAKRGRTRTN